MQQAFWGAQPSPGDGFTIEVIGPAPFFSLAPREQRPSRPLWVSRLDLRSLVMLQVWRSLLR